MYDNTQDIRTQADDITAALRGLKPNEQHHKIELFSMLRPVIEEMLEKNVTQKAILKTLSDMGLKLHPARFKELMATSRNGVGCDPHTSVGNTTPLTSEGA